METSEILNLIRKTGMIIPGDKIGVAVSGGVDSMSLLHFLYKNHEELGCSVIAITVDHMLRGEESQNDAEFVCAWCKQNGIEVLKFSADVQFIATQKSMCIEEAAREARYSIFENLLSQGVVNKIALAHHISDQAETILLNIIRGAGLNGACGMSYIRDNCYIRPFLDLTKDEIIKYSAKNYIDFVQDKTNQDTKYNRNYLRNVVLPGLKERWPAVEQNLANFAKNCREDNEYILKHVCHDGVIVENDMAKIPLIYFHYENSVINRIVFGALQSLKATKDFEKKHYDMLKTLAKGENGKKLNLPNNLVAQKEYDYITLFKLKKTEVFEEYPLKIGTTNFAGYYEIKVKRVKTFDKKPNCLYLDENLVPKTAMFRTRKAQDMFTKFGGGTKTLREYMIDKKIPNRVRQTIPVLALGHEVYCLLGHEISDQVKITENTKKILCITCKESKRNEKN